MYNKTKINDLTREYVKAGDNRIFEQLLISLRPMVWIILQTRYAKAFPYFDDMVQEILLKIWQFRQKPEQLNKQTVNPSSYWFYVIRAYANIVFDQFNKIYKFDSEITFTDYGVRLLTIIQDAFLDPESRYYFKVECPKILFRRCKKDICNHVVLRNNPRGKGKVIQKIKKLIEEDFGVRVPSE